jgi:hypothetical protein
LKYHEQAALALAAVSMDVVKIDATLLRLSGYSLSEVLSENGFSSPDFSNDQHALGHFARSFQSETEELI